MGSPRDKQGKEAEEEEEEDGVRHFVVVVIAFCHRG